MSHRDACLVINAGSSSLKFSVFCGAGRSDLEAVLTGQISGIGTAPRFEAKDAARHVLADGILDEVGPGDRAGLLGFLLTWMRHELRDVRLVAAGHRVVHGGTRFDAPVRLTPAVLAELEALVPLAPLHQPHNIAAMTALAEVYPELPQVACFDTAFHSTRPWQAQMFALPRELTDEGVRRYGFHGLSYEYIAQRLPQIAPELAEARVVVCHLGSGSSLCGMRAGRSVDTTMGFTALDGLPMGTRPGAIDPGVLIYLMREKGMGPDELERLLYHKSGLLGVSGVSNDMRALLDSENPQAAEAVELFCFQVAKQAAGLAAAMGGLDAVVFTAGVGENSAPVRARVAEKLGWLGVHLDGAANRARATRISAADSRVPVFVIPTDEERMIASHTLGILARNAVHPPLAA
ncbi:acetate/propionate family kinase [Azospirillum brasilense]|uniref:acetate/propionate family kinase n=1 Tax=Azospirillum brasilense TaxID=192 RepID=UPI000E698423|nr:acetate/propionate family kinase [Azospirillum brasilense]NUB26832.1 acetate/propionate family kinase [Azospirillum brasilense]NUB36257.1 acetate/propionate family kinase [Azospirillum brasilense]RIV96416.1 acetate/propionate family kinase [Azospirillum brasilense]